MSLLDYVKQHSFSGLGGNRAMVPVEEGFPDGPTSVDMEGDGGVDMPGPTLKDKVASGAGPSPAFTEDPTEKNGNSPSDTYHDQTGDEYNVYPGQSNPATQRPPGGTLKDKIIKAVTAIAPVALGGAFGGAAGATGAGEGELELNQQNQQLDLKNRTLESESQNRIMQRIQEQQRYEESIKRDKTAQDRADNAEKNFNTTNQRLVDAMNKPSKPSDEEEAYATDKQPGETRTAFHQRYATAGRAPRVTPVTPGTRMVGPDGKLLSIEPGGEVPKGSKTPAQFGAPAPEGPHAVMVTPEGKVIDAKPGMQLPTGSQTPSSVSSVNAGNVKADKGVTDDISFAQSYLASGKPSGSSDEALLERFFDLTKPSTGFRMNKPQQDLLFNSRSWMDSASARFRHATSGTWFSDDQRHQIVQTMLDVAKANGVSIDGLAPGNAAPGQGGAGSRGGVRPPTSPAAPQTGELHYDRNGNRVK